MSGENELILGIESSCDETAAAVLCGGRKVLSMAVHTQIPVHRLYGGVVPEIASRSHTERIGAVADEALKTAGVGLNDIGAIAVTCTPGLIGALLVGVSYAKGLAYAANIPLVGVNHIAGHIAANYLTYPDLEPPFVCIVASGGHSHIVKVNSNTELETVGKTPEDAAGAAFDKAARAMGFQYPGGVHIDRAAKQGDAKKYKLPRPATKNPYDFSFSGVKSAVLNYINQAQMKGEEVNRADLAASFQKAVVDALVSRAVRLAKECGMDKLAIAGGVASNSALRAAVQEECAKNNIKFYSPSPVLCTDNAAMIGAAAYYEYIKGVRHGYDLNAVPNLKLGERI